MAQLQATQRPAEPSGSVLPGSRTNLGTRLLPAARCPPPSCLRRMKVGLEEMYKGSTRKLQMTRSVKCEKCSGSGSKSGKRYTCEVRCGPYFQSATACLHAWFVWPCRGPSAGNLEPGA